MKTKSVYGFFIRIFIFLATSISLFTMLYGGSSLQDARERYLQMIISEADVRAEALQTYLEDIDSFCRITLHSDPDMELLSLPHIADSKRVVSEFNIRRILLSRTSSAGGTILYHEGRDSMLYSYGDAVMLTPLEKISLSEHFVSRIRLGEVFSIGAWFLDCFEGRYYLCIYHNLRSEYLCSVVDISAYMTLDGISHLQELGAIYLCSDGILWSSEPEWKLPTITEVGEGLLRVGNYTVCPRKIASAPLMIAFAMPQATLLQLLIPQVVFFGVSLLLIIFVLVMCFLQLRRALLFPLNEIANLSASMTESLDIAPIKAPYTEFIQIREGMKKLLDQKAILERERQEKVFAEQHALLQYYQLQTRSHFFLNCLKSLYNMAEQYNAGKMQMMIVAFSAHLRFIFHDTLALVPLKAEIQEVNDYHKIISQDIPRPFILTIDCPPQLEECQVPPLVIQTFLENTFKHNGTSGTPLVFRVEISRVELENGAPFLRIHISDNGIGYSAEAISSLNALLEDNFDRYHVGINNLRRRMLILYKNECQLAFYNGSTGGAITVIFIPLSENQGGKYDSTDCG